LLTKDQIRKKLKDNPYWEPADGATHEEWDLYDEVCEELDNEGDGVPYGDDDADEGSDWSTEDDNY